LGFTKVLREELKDKGVRVSAVLPGATLTQSWDGVDLPKDRFIPAEDIASTIFSAYQMSPSTVIEEILIRPQLGDI
jgi:NADP-dependent 3-hydroxy acid dehydrogenase YdfG